MELTKHGHACVALEQEGRRVVIDPGTFTDPVVLAGTDAVLITHEHADHLHVEALRTAAEANPGLEVWTNGSVAARLEGTGVRVHVVGEEDTFEAQGFTVSVHGQVHAEIHPDVPRIPNIGFLVEGTLFHPGDALTVPAGVGVETLLLPVHAPWSRTGELVDYVRAVAPHRALAVHDGLLNDNGLAVVGRLLGDGGPGTGAPYTRVEVGETLTLA